MTRSKKHSESTPKSSDHSPSTIPPGTSWFERPVNISKLIIGLEVACILVVLADLFYTNPHPHFDIESTFAFQAWFGFVTFVVIVFLGRVLRLFISRPEDYYDRDR